MDFEDWYLQDREKYESFISSLALTFDVSFSHAEESILETVRNIEYPPGLTLEKACKALEKLADFAKNQNIE